MAKVKFKNKKSLQKAKDKLYKNVSFRRMKDGRKIAAKWPNRRKKSKK